MVPVGEDAPLPKAAPDDHPRWGRAALLGAILLVAAALRLPALDRFPPGLHQDEAANAWNAYCLLKTGTDQFGVPWPVFCLRAIGDFRSTLYTYALLPFQAVGGLNVWTTRLPAAVGGVLTVLLLYGVAARLFGRGTGLVAALLLAVNPTHVQMSRLGLEAAHTPLLILAPLLLILWAGLPLADGDRRPGVVRCVLAGLVTGICCYGYPAVRLYLPVFLTAAVVVTAQAWWRMVRAPRGWAALAGFGLAVAVTFGPLAYQHLARPERIGKRGGTTWVWDAGDPAGVRVQRVLARYASHFGPEFLWHSADRDQSFWVVPLGFLPRYTVPFLLSGLGVVLWRVRRSRAVRVLLVGALLFPCADALNWHLWLHNLRASAGLWALILLAAVGVAAPAAWLAKRRMRASLLAFCLAVGALLAPETIGFGRAYFVERPKKGEVYYHTHGDILAACDWLRPRLDDADAVVFFAGGPHARYTAYLVALVRLQHDPRAWFAEPREIDTSGVWDRCSRYGKFYFLHDDERAALLARFRADDRRQRVILLLRPTDMGPGEPAATITSPEGQPAVVIYECDA